MARRTFAVLESRWSENEKSIRPLYDLLAASDYEAGVYVYERFVSKTSLVEALKFIGNKERPDYIYVGAHGEGGKFKFPDGTQIGAGALSNILSIVSPIGVFLSSCQFVTEKNAKLLLKKKKKTYSPKWVCGYGNDAGWISSALFEAQFFAKLFDDLNKKEKGKKNYIDVMAKYYKRNTNAFSNEFGFNIFVRGPGDAMQNITALS